MARIRGGFEPGTVPQHVPIIVLFKTLTEAYMNVRREFEKRARVFPVFGPHSLAYCRTCVEPREMVHAKSNF